MQYEYDKKFIKYTPKVDRYSLSQPLVYYKNIDVLGTNIPDSNKRL